MLDLEAERFEEWLEENYPDIVPDAEEWEQEALASQAHLGGKRIKRVPYKRPLAPPNLPHSFTGKIIHVTTFTFPYSYDYDN